VTTYIIKRLVQSIGALLVAVSLVFALIHSTGDPVTMMLGENATQEDIERISKELGLDKPVAVQYILFLSRLLHGDIGESFRHRRPVSELISSRLLPTLQLAGFALLLSLGIGLPAGLIAAIRRNSLLDQSLMILTIAGLAIPRFWLGLMLILGLGLTVPWLPVSGRGSFAHLVLPGVALAVPSAARLTRFVRTGVLEVINKEYITTARAKGLPSRTVICKHVLRPALLAPVTDLALELGALIGQTVVIEVVFAWPGVGRLAIEAIWARDYPVIMGFVITLSIVYILLSLIADLVVGWLDPRIVYS